MRHFHCDHCQATVFFENDTCLSCGAQLGFVPDEGQMRAFVPPADAPPRAPWARANGQPALSPCANRFSASLCNWMLAADPVAQGDGVNEPPLCLSCRLTEVLPALDAPENGLRWQRIEQAKRRLLFTLLGLGLVPTPKQGPDDTQGLAFHLLADQPGAPRVKTGHDRGTITINVAEADDDLREAVRVRLGEPTRTLLGHLRHETAHYLHYRWIDGTPAADTCRAAFGDERVDYAEALARHYSEGPPHDWSLHFVSAYASAHPWEDWAETCAHYLLVHDAVQTAASWGMQLSGSTTATPLAPDVGPPPGVAQLVLQQWLPVAQFLNAMNRSIGRRDSYPHLLPPDVLHKMGVVQSLLQAVAHSGMGATGQPQEAEVASAPLAGIGTNGSFQAGTFPAEG